MTLSFSQRIFRLSLALVLLGGVSAVFAQSSHVGGAHLKLVSIKGRSYSSTTDASGKFGFSNVEPGSYKLVWALPEGTDIAKTGECTIDISSFSFGSSNAQGRNTPATRSNISNNRTTGGTDAYGGGGGTGKVQFQDFHFSKQASSFSQSGGELSIVLGDEMQIDISDPHGEIAGMAINEKGLPGDKGPKKGNK